MIAKQIGSDSSYTFVSAAFVLLSLSLFPAWCVVDAALSLQLQQHHELLWTRRQALIGAAAKAASSGLIISTSCSSCIVATQAAAVGDAAIDLAAFNAARVSGGSSARIQSINSISPNSPIRGKKSSSVYIPRVGYSLYKTPLEQVPRCVALALRAGIRHFDLATLYGSNSMMSKPLQQYLNGGFAALNKDYYNNEKIELLQLFDYTAMITQQRHDIQTIASSPSLWTAPSPPNMDGSAGRRSRRSQLFLSHKLSNSEQSTDSIAVKRRVKQTIAALGVGYLDLISIHSPLTDKARRLGTYKALLELRDAGFVRSVGVCNYGIGPLMEIQDEFEVLGGGRGGFNNNQETSNLPAINQLELSPFNKHQGVVQYCDRNDIAVGCSAWSKLSGVDGPVEGWAVLSDLAKAKGATKAQVLVRWSLQKGYVCVPRSGCSSKLERMAIAENSYGGVNMVEEFVLSDKEMELLDNLDIVYKAGKLGRRDGWEDSDVTDLDWDPTDFV